MSSRAYSLKLPKFDPCALVIARHKLAEGCLNAVATLLICDIGQHNTGEIDGFGECVVCCGSESVDMPTAQRPVRQCGRKIIPHAIANDTVRGSYITVRFRHR